MTQLVKSCKVSNTFEQSWVKSCKVTCRFFLPGQCACCPPRQCLHCPCANEFAATKKPPKKLQNKQPNSLTLSMQSFALFVTTTSSLQTRAMRRRQWWHSVAMMLLSTPPLPTTKGKKTKTRTNNPTHCHCKHNHLRCSQQPHHHCKHAQHDDGP